MGWPGGQAVKGILSRESIVHKGSGVGLGLACFATKDSQRVTEVRPVQNRQRWWIEGGEGWGQAGKKE